MKRALKIVAVVFVLLIAVVVSAPWWFDFNYLRGPIASAVIQATGRDAHIDNIAFDMGWTPKLSVDGITLGNAEWADTPNMVRVKRFAVSIRLRELLSGRIVVPEVVVASPVVDLVRNAEGQANWAFGPTEKQAEPKDEQPARGDFPIIKRMALTNGQFRYRDATRDFDYVAKIENFEGNAGGDAPLRARANGSIQDEPFTLKLDAGSMIALRNEDKRYPVDMDVTVGQTHAAASGDIDRPLALRGLDIDVLFEGPNLAKLFPVLGVPLPATPPYRLSGLLSHKGSVWGFKNFDGRVGDSDLTGDFNVDIGGERMKVNADLASQKIDFDDLAPIIGAPPDSDETASEKQEVKAEKVTESDHVIPDTEFKLDKLQTSDAKVALKAKRIEAPGLPIDDLDLDLELSGGVLRLKPLQFGVADGNMNAYATIDASNPTILWNYDVRIRALRLHDLLNALPLDDVGSGRLGGDIKLKARGNTIHEMLGDSDGRVNLVVAGGTFSNLLLELAGVDLSQALGLLVTDDQKVPIRCVVGDVDLDQGNMKSRTLVVDTEDTRINGQLTADLEEETFDLKLDPSPKDASLFSAATPVALGGSFKDVSVSPDWTSLAVRTGASVALGALATPAAALLAFVELGLGEDARCDGLLRSTEKPAPDEAAAES